jgi:predicted RNase H-like nuclease
MGSRRRSASQAIDLPSDGGVNLERLFTPVITMRRYDGRDIDSATLEGIVATFIGIDGIPRGWAAVYLNDNGNHQFGWAGCAKDLLRVPYERAMIDMPIGLPARGYRLCDAEARALIGPKVFLGARYGVWRFKTLDQANSYYWKAEGPGRGISIQLFCIRKKLQELNEPSIPPRVFEAHPELFFWRVAGHILESKKSGMGRAERIEILTRNGLGMVSDWLQQRRGTGIGRDDLIDGLRVRVSCPR